MELRGEFFLRTARTVEVEVNALARTGHTAAHFFVEHGAHGTAFGILDGTPVECRGNGAVSDLEDGGGGLRVQMDTPGRRDAPLGDDLAPHRHVDDGRLRIVRADVERLQERPVRQKRRVKRQAQRRSLAGGQAALADSGHPADARPHEFGQPHGVRPVVPQGERADRALRRLHHDSGEGAERRHQDRHGQD